MIVDADIECMVLEEIMLLAYRIRRMPEGFEDVRGQCMVLLMEYLRMLERGWANAEG